MNYENGSKNVKQTCNELNGIIHDNYIRNQKSKKSQEHYYKQVVENIKQDYS